MPGSYIEASGVEPAKGVKKWFGKESAGWKIFLAAFFVCILTIFIHFREVKMEVLELGSISKQYIIAQIDFEYPQLVF